MNDKNEDKYYIIGGGPRPTDTKSEELRKAIREVWHKVAAREIPKAREVLGLPPRQQK